MSSAEVRVALILRDPEGSELQRVTTTVRLHDGRPEWVTARRYGAGEAEARVELVEVEP